MEQKIIDFCTPIYDKKDEMHGMSHINRLLCACAEKTTPDMDVAIWLHGVIEAHEEDVRKLLNSLSMNTEHIIQIAKDSIKSNTPKTPEGKTLHDAHLLEGGDDWLFLKSILTGYARGQTFAQTADYYKNNLYRKHKCFDPKNQEIFEAREDKALKAFNQKMLVIKEVDETDLENVMALWNNGQVMKFVGFPTGLHKTIDDMRTWFEKLKGNRLTWNRYAIYDADLGFCGETGYTLRDGTYDMDIKLLPHTQGRGIAKQAFSYAITQAFQNGAESVQVSPWDVNERSIPLYLKLGFKETHRQNVKDMNSSNPLFQSPGSEVIYMTLDKKDWTEK